MLAILLSAPLSLPALGQFGGGGGGGMGGGGGGGASAPGPDSKPKFREFVHDGDGIAVRREKGDAIVLDVRVVGNKRVTMHRILQQVQTRKDRFYDYETVLGDVRRLNDLGSFDHVTFKLNEQPSGVGVTFIVHERPTISQVVFHGNRAMNERELKGRAGVNPNDPLSEFSIESARRRLSDYYREEGFNQVSVLSSVGLPNDASAVVFRINEGPKERIASIAINGSTIVSEARLKTVIKSSDGFAGGWVPYIGNTFDIAKLDQDVDILAAYYHNLGFLTATVGRTWKYRKDGKWVDVVFVVNEGPQFKVNEVQIVGNQYAIESSLRERLKLNAGDTFDGTKLRQDVGEMVYAYGELGFIYAEIEPQTVMRDEANIVDLVYKITEGDRWKVGKIRVNIDGEPHLMKETTMLNLIDLREGDWIDRRALETNRSRLERSQLLETNPQIAEPPDIKVVPTDEGGKRY
ncbi:BamA/OMP85 family outer membrane protein [Rubripirellula reticaptiva]|uniref:Outer membrane protein assembly factor BamA n=1 Tax=Rubripirellula reticaptiva TaxID=2528013 RepID=A0A5C6F4B9_9BACT|nr:POTRA domain-containing protein [Rubripirellula reticaptiva]TWU55370.1 Outer membrane protein assembly factor BamA precursor [Rubripirellula reticaptiva]